VLRELGPGAIVLLHDSALYARREDAAATAAAVPAIATAAGERDLSLLTLSGALDGD
jgi:hypothetical protein